MHEFPHAMPSSQTRQQSDAVDGLAALVGAVLVETSPSDQQQRGDIAHAPTFVRSGYRAQRVSLPRRPRVVREST
jgi:hypothetical protein